MNILPMYGMKNTCKGSILCIYRVYAVGDRSGDTRNQKNL